MRASIPGLQGAIFKLKFLSLQCSNSEKPHRKRTIQAVQSVYVWQYFAVTNHADAKEGWAKNAICNFMTKASVDEDLPEQQHIS